MQMPRWSSNRKTAQHCTTFHQAYMRQKGGTSASTTRRSQAHSITKAGLGAFRGGVLPLAVLVSSTSMSEKMVLNAGELCSATSSSTPADLSMKISIPLRARIVARPHGSATRDSK